MGIDSEDIEMEEVNLNEEFFDLGGLDEYDSDEEYLSEIEEINRRSLYKIFSAKNIPIKITDSNEKESDISASTESSRNYNYNSFLVKRKISQANPNSV